jgi:hypothetical protein
LELLQAQFDVVLKEKEDLELRNNLLMNKMESLERQYKVAQTRFFSLQRFTSDVDISFYTGFPNYATFKAVFDFLNPGPKGENVRYCSSGNREVSDSYYNSCSDSDSDDDETARRRGRPLITETNRGIFTGTV